MDWRILYNPLAALGRRTGIIVAILVIIVLTGVAWWGGVHLDGALDLHVTVERPSLALVVAESLIAWLSLALLLFAASRVAGGNGGPGAHLAAAGLSRFPYIPASVIGSRQALGKALLAAVTVEQKRVTLQPQVLMNPAVIVGILALTAFIVWAIAMLYLGYKEASRLRGGKAAASFIIGLLFAELVSKLLTVWLMGMGI